MLLYTTTSRLSMKAPPSTIINSLSITITNAAQGIIPDSVWHSMAVTTMTLSARGSMSLPKAVIWLFLRARYPSRKSVKLATRKVISAHFSCPVQ